MSEINSCKTGFINKLINHLAIVIMLLLIGCSPERNQVITGEEFFLKTLFYKAPMTSITHIIQDDLDFQPGTEIGVFDQRGLHVINQKTGKLKSKITFKWTSGILHPSLLSDINRHFNIMSKGGGFGDVGVLNENGEVMFIYKPTTNDSINSMAAGDLDHDGVIEYYVATNNGLHKLNHKGEKIWHKGDWAYDVEVYDPGNNQAPVILTITENHNRYILQFWNSEGEVIKNIKLKIRAYKIELINWPTPGHLLVKSGSSFFILDMDGNIIFEHKLASFFSLKDYEIFRIRGTAVKLYEHKKPYLAVLTDFRASSGKSMLSVFDPDGKLVSKELISVTTGLAAVRLPSSKTEILLVGDGPGNVYKYQLKKTN